MCFGLRTQTQNTSNLLLFQTKKRQLSLNALKINGYVDMGCQIKFSPTKEKSFVRNFLQIEKSKMTPAHPQCNAQAEVVNKSIKKYWMAMTEKSSQRKHLIPLLAFAYNTTIHRTKVLSPAKMLFGYRPRWMITTVWPVKFGK